MRCFKGFDKNLECRGFAYEIGKEYKETKAELCNSGFHACENPIDVFGYYPPAESRYCEVELEDVSEEMSDDSKRCGKRIRIGAEVGIKGIVDAFVKFTLERTDCPAKRATNTGDRSAATNTGYYSAATNTGNYSAATNTGYQSAATNTGYQSAATNTGYQSAATNTGDQSAATNTGYQSAATNTGDRSAATNTGYRSAATVEGAESIAIATGMEGKARGALGCYIVLAEWAQDENYDWHIKTVKAHKVDGETVKPNVFYTLEDGKFTEVR